MPGPVALRMLRAGARKVDRILRRSAAALSVLGRLACSPAAPQRSASPMIPRGASRALAARRESEAPRCFFFRFLVLNAKRCRPSRANTSSRVDSPRLFRFCAWPESPESRPSLGRQPARGQGLELRCRAVQLASAMPRNISHRPPQPNQRDAFVCELPRTFGISLRRGGPPIPSAAWKFYRDQHRHAIAIAPTYPSLQPRTPPRPPPQALPDRDGGPDRLPSKTVQSSATASSLRNASAVVSPHFRHVVSVFFTGHGTSQAPWRRRRL